MAAALVHHEPGWRLPRHTELARRYNVTTAEIDTAVGDLAARRLVRRLPDGQLYRASPAEYLIPLEGLHGLASRVDPMGGEITCRSRRLSWRRVPEDIACLLRIGAESSVYVIRSHWTSAAEPAALVTTYLAAQLADLAAAPEDDVLPAAMNTLPLLPLQRDAGGGEALLRPRPGCAPGALSIEMQPPSPSVARSLRLSPGRPAALITVRFDESRDSPVAVTIAVVRPELFRIIVESPAPGPAEAAPNGIADAWTHTVGDWQ